MAAVKFPPEGQRGFGSPFVLQNFEAGLSLTEYLQQANDSLLTMVQIETREALDSVEDIAPLVDVVFIGPYDLGNNIGHPILGDKMDPELRDAIERVLRAAVAAGRKCGIYCISGAQAKHYADMGFHMISVATDYSTLGEEMVKRLAIARGQAQGDEGGSY